MPAWPNPTRTVLEANLAVLEGAEHGICFASGVAAIEAILKRLRPGDQVLAMDDLYGGTVRLFRDVFEPYGLTFGYVDMTHLSRVEAAIRPGNQAGVDRDADESAVAHRGYREGFRDGACLGCGRGRRQHVRLAVPAATDCPGVRICRCNPRRSIWGGIRMSLVGP